MKLATNSFTRSGARIALALAMLVIGAAGAQSASAAASLCRTDPIVKLSNGFTVTLYADVDADVSDLASVDYTLQVPPGVTVVSVTHPNAATASVEHFSYSSNGPTKDYTATTAVKLKSGTRHNVTAYMDSQAPSQAKVRSDNRSGKTAEVLPMSVDIRN